MALGITTLIARFCIARLISDDISKFSPLNTL